MHRRRWDKFLGKAKLQLSKNLFSSGEKELKKRKKEEKLKCLFPKISPGNYRLDRPGERWVKVFRPRCYTYCFLPLTLFTEVLFAGQIIGLQSTLKNISPYNSRLSGKLKCCQWWERFSEYLNFSFKERGSQVSLVVETHNFSASNIEY